jgi:tetratricopeptide (TPR) repeat protein
MTTQSSIASALAAYREGRRIEAFRAAEEVWRTTPDARAAGLLALIEMEAGHLDAALAWSDRARAADPRDVRHALQGARVAALKGDHAQAFERLKALLAEAPRTDAAWSDFAAAARASGREAEAAEFCIRAFDVHPTAPLTLLALLSLTPDTPPSGAPAATEPVSPRCSVSVVTCSIDDGQFAAMAASYDRALAGWPHEIVRVADATSLAAGYNRGFARATGDIVVFTHDDVEIIATDFGDRLVRGLRECDVLGIAGATRATGPAWPFAGWPYLHGSVIYPDDKGYRVTVYSRTVPLARGIRVMDGVFLATRREIAASIGWDAETCDGFHCYDVDFTLRAAQAGLRLAVASDLGVVHRSYGNFDEEWAASARRLQAKHPELNGVRGYETGFVARSVPDAARAMALVDNWAKMGATRG